MTAPIRSSLAGFGLGVLISIPLVLLAVVWAAGGHGTYALAKILFPIPLIFAVIHGSIAPPIVGLALVQFPLYGLIYGALYRSRYFRYYAIGLAIIHSLLAIIVILQGDQGFA
jgi:hypothetical protein